MALGPSFPSELATSGLLGLPIAWTSEGVNFGDVIRPDGSISLNAALSQEDRAAIESVIDAHDPTLPAPLPVPQVVSRWQGREAMRITEWGDSDVISAVEAVLADPATPAYYRTAWDELQQFELDSPMLISIAEVIGMTQAQRHDMFRLADSLRA